MSDNPPPLVLLTRPRAQSERFARALDTRLPGVAVAIAPLMEVVPLPAPPEARTAPTMIFTSENAVPQAGAGQGRLAWCVGTRTQAAARAAGFRAHSVDGTANDLVARLAQDPPPGPIWHLHGVHVRGDVAKRLCRAGLDVREAAVYDQREMPPDATLDAALARDGVIAPVFSPRSAKLLAQAAEGADAARLTLVAISAAARDALPAAWQDRTILAETPDAAAILEAIARRIGT
ncbi:Uroporphyrinogen-III synthase [Roseibacterium elongatum DSM 19469]|uniref:Uroporphyrinogen-III synthase n=1 Tax=Roseicyclus elongatus DSM 19469 TaxID=1294273 RepID=W8S0S5_9RHOB|nr:uroporphyrinogen-III synthase [Roseibacterium elongatum]AHM03762.1 Uroporphyrinogen-III synthase [Roseibacterium elongatum DSM 19469]